MFTLVFCLQTIKRNEPAPHLDALIGQRLLSLTLHGRSTALNCAITPVQYQPYNTVEYVIDRLQLVYNKYYSK